MVFIRKAVLKTENTWSQSLSSSRADYLCRRGSSCVKACVLFTQLIIQSRLMKASHFRLRLQQSAVFPHLLEHKRLLWSAIFVVCLLEEQQLVLTAFFNW